MQPLDDEHMRLALLHLHEQGVELTTAQLRQRAAEQFATVRTMLRADGHEVPDDDKELFLYLQRLRARL